jgi:hypothetical protein
MGEREAGRSAKKVEETVAVKRKGKNMIEKNALGMTMQINEEFINNLAKQMVSESIMATIGGGDKFVQQITADILKTKVNPDTGRVESYSSSIPYIQYLINKVIREEVSGTIQEILDEKRPEIRECIRAELLKDKTIDAFYKGFIKNVTDSIDCRYKTSINVFFNEGCD